MLIIRVDFIDIKIMYKMMLGRRLYARVTPININVM